jgi:hypothetical protein
LKRPPQLQRKNNFENTVSRLSQEFSLNSVFITHSPDCPALCGKVGPNKSLGSQTQAVQDEKPLKPGARIPVNLEHEPHPTLEELGQRALKENVFNMLYVATKCTLSLGRAESSKNLIVRGETPPWKLPCKDLDFEWHSIAPQIIG